MADDHLLSKEKSCRIDGIDGRNVRNIAKLNEQELKLGIFYEKRSWHAEYKDSAYIFIGGLPYDLTEGDIICVFSQYGEIVNINLVRDKKTGKSKGYGFMAYEDQRSTILAVDNFNGIKLGGRTIRVDHVQEYRRPKGDEKDETGKYKDKIETGCAPKPVTPPQSSSENEDSSKVVAHASKKAKKRKKKKKKEERDKKYRNDDDSHSQSDTDSESEIKRKFKKELKRDREKHRASDIDDSIGNESEDDRSRKPGKETSKKGKRLERKYGSDSASVTKDDYENKSKKNKKPKRDDGETRISDKIGIDLNGLREDNYRKHREETTDRGRSYKDDYKEKKYRDRSRGDRDDHKMHRRKERGQEREKYDNYRETTDRGGKERDDRNRRDRSKEDRRSKRGRHKSGHSSETEPYRDKRDADYKDKYDKSKPTDSYKHR